MPGPPEEGLRCRGHQLQGIRLLRHRLPLEQVEHRQLLEFRLLLEGVLGLVVEGSLQHVDFAIEQLLDREHPSRKLSDAGRRRTLPAAS